jgi:hypothetical protein
MTAARLTAACFLLLLSPLAHCDSTEPSVVADSCPGVAAWNASHADQLPTAIAARDKQRTLTAPDLLAELESRTDADQRARKKMLAASRSSEAMHDVAAIDADNDAWMIKLLQRQGLPTVGQVGERGLGLLWLLVQHADRYPKLQAIALRDFEKRHAAGELPADDLARLTDRVLLHQGKPQLYGTQFDWTSGKFEPRGVQDSAEIDTNRRQLGLMPLEDYACKMNAVLKDMQ